MKKHFLLPALMLLALSPVALADLENGNFAAGKNKWQGDGKAEKVEGENVISVALSKNNFSELKQSFRMAPTVKRIKVSLQVQASSDYVLNDKSRSISDVDFSPNGNVTWTGLVHPKSDFHIRLKDDSFNYKLTKVAPGGGWVTLTAEIRGIKKPTGLDLALVFPPGDGTMAVKNVTVEEIKE
ncbi:hypothetical protein [Roseimicrobium sp. ORNL1]|uniref:hypothetical protein n=1 Tax=Roseimicrobium sp. ORNL1 TaxID=2711231 RepID=UPI0013E1F19D|nr:hypothetical protein [Roseimicrobium sp. ORNL1]QIF04075.1 hypothetical protein G5S37_21935 [Roseimicrobium sp. ORNL1]